MVGKDAGADAARELAGAATTSSQALAGAATTSAQALADAATTSAQALAGAMTTSSQALAGAITTSATMSTQCMVVMVVAMVVAIWAFMTIRSDAAKEALAMRSEVAAFAKEALILAKALLDNGRACRA